MGSDRDGIEDEISVRGLVRELRWLAPVVLLTLLVIWGFDAVRGGSSIPFWMVILGWVYFTVVLGPLLWVRGLRKQPGWWRALGLAVLWSLGCMLLFGIGYGVMAGLFGLGE